MKDRCLQVVPAVLLVLLVAGGIAAWAFWPSPPAPRASAAHAGDDLEGLAAPKAGREAAQDVYAADPSGVYVASAHDHALRRLPLGPGDASIATGAELLRLDTREDVAVIATGSGTLCLASGRDGPRGRMTVRAGPLADGPLRVVRPDGPPVLAIACDRDAIFVASADESSSGLLQKSSIERLPVAGGPNTAIGHSDGAVTSLALDEARVYWADSIDEKIVAVPKAGGPPLTLAENRGLPRSIVAYGDALFWVEQRGESVWTMPKNGGAPRLVVQDFAGFSHLTAGPGGVYWVNEGAVDGGFRVLRAPLTGGDATPISPAADGIDAVLVVGAAILWASEGRVSGAVAGTAPSR